MVVFVQVVFIRVGGGGVTCTSIRDKNHPDKNTRANHPPPPPPPDITLTQTYDLKDIILNIG